MKRKPVPNAALFSEVRQLLAGGCNVTILARGNSMFPFIRDGLDKVQLSAVRSPDGAVCSFSTGDILLCEIESGHYVLHRLVRNENGILTLMGDGNLRGTEKCTAGNVVARAVAIIRPDGTTVSCSGHTEMQRARTWHRLLPFRRILLALWRRLHLNPL